MEKFIVTPKEDKTVTMKDPLLLYSLNLSETINVFVDGKEQKKKLISLLRLFNIQSYEIERLKEYERE